MLENHAIGRPRWAFRGEKELFYLGANDGGCLSLIIQFSIAEISIWIFQRGVPLRQYSIKLEQILARVGANLS